MSLSPQRLGESEPPPSSASALPHHGDSTPVHPSTHNTSTTSSNQPPPSAGTNFSIFRSTVDPFASFLSTSPSTVGLDLAEAISADSYTRGDIDRSHSLGGESASHIALLFKSDRLRRKKNLKKAQQQQQQSAKQKRNSLHVFDTVSLANVASQFTGHQQQHQSSNATVANGLAATVAHQMPSSMLPYTTPTSATGTMDIAAVSAAMGAPVGGLSLDGHRLPTESNIPVVATTIQPVKRNVIIQRDSRGYGIRISGDNPVSIESVHPDGAAFKAGVRNGDRIIKVNGTLVTRLSHADVVRMIQNCGSFVGLTLLSNPSATASATASSHPIDPHLSTSPQANSPTPPLGIVTSTHLIAPIGTGSGATSPSLAMAPLGPQGASGTGTTVQITSPQQAPESTMQSFQNNKITTLQRMIEQQEETLKNSKEAKARADAQRTLEDLKRRYYEMVNAANSSSNNNNHFDGTSAGSAPTGRPAIITVDSDYEDNVPDVGPSGLPIPSSDLSDFGVLVDGHEEAAAGFSGLNNGTLRELASKSPPSKSGGFLSKIPGSSKSKHRDSKGFTLNSGLLASAGGMLAAPVMTGLGLGPISLANSSGAQVPITMEHIEVHSLRFARYLINNCSVPPNPLLFYVIAKHIFPAIVANATSIVVNSSRAVGGGGHGLIESGLRTLIQRWAHQIMATWICNYTPLFFHEFPPDSLEAFDQKLTSFIGTVSGVGTNGLAANPFDAPFLEKAQEIVSKQLQEFQAAVQVKPELLATLPKVDLQATVEQLLHGAPAGATTTGGTLGPKLDLNQVDTTVDTFISSAQMQGNGSTLAVISSLLTIGHFVFGVSTKHLLLSDPQTCISLLLNSTALLPPATAPITPSPVATNPVLKLSVESSSSANKSKHKRMTSLPAQPKPTMTNGSAVGALLGDLTGGAGGIAGGINENGHSFVQVADMPVVKYCSGCQLSLWGDLYNYRCPRCLLYVHFWCIKTTAPANACESSLDQSTAGAGAGGVLLRNSQSTREPSRKKQKTKDKKTSMMERLTGKTIGFPRSSIADVNTSSSLARSHSSLSSSSSSSDSHSLSSSDYDYDHSSGMATSHSGALDEEGGGKMTSTGSTMTSPVQGISAGGAAAISGGRAPLPVNRSGSFNQRKKTKHSSSSSTPRKRSDPALTSSRMSTITGAISGSIDSPTPPTLSSAQSSGALLNYSSSAPQGGGVADAGQTTSGLQHQTSVPGGQFRPLNKGTAAKKMTASDSSLMSATTSISAASNFANQSSINLTSTAAAASPRQRRERKDRKKTADSAIVCNTSESETDETAPLTVKSPEEPFGYDNETIKAGSIDETVNPYRSGDASTGPPPLPPRPVSEKRRQIKAEIVESELNHYETLRFIRNVYQKPIRKEKIFSHEQMAAIFGNTKELKSTHKKIYKEMRASHLSEVDLFDTGSLERALMEIFSGHIGRDLERQAGEFVKNHKLNGGMEIFNQKKKDSRLKACFDTDLKAKEMPDCRWSRLSLQDLLGSVFQRPLRYPLLLERLLKATPMETAAYKHLEVALSCSKRIAHQINEYMRRADLDARLKEIVKNTDISFFGTKHLDTREAKEIMNSLQTQTLIHEGPLVWRTTKTKFVDVNLVLTDSMILVLTRDSSGDRYQLKKHTNPAMNKLNSSNPSSKRTYKLDIRMTDLLTREVATDQTAFFLVSNSQDVFYEFAAATASECKTWKDVITNAINDYRERHPNLVNAAVASRSTSRLQDLAPPRTPPTEATVTTNNSNNLTSPPASLLNRPLPKPPSDVPSTAPSNAPPSPPPPPPPPPQSKPIAGTIQNVTAPETLVPFKEVKVVSHEAKMHFAGPYMRADSSDYIVHERWKSIEAQVMALKQDIGGLMNFCDVQRQFSDIKEDTEVAQMKYSIVSELLELAIKIDHNNRPTLEPFEPLVGKVQTYLQKLNNDNTSPMTSLNPFDTEPEHLAQAQASAAVVERSPEQQLERSDSKEVLVDEDDLDEERREMRSRSGSSSKSQECLQIIEDMQGLQITEFDASRTTTAVVSSSSSATATISTTSSSSTLESSAESFTTVVSREVVTATKLVASNSLNPFDRLNDSPSELTTSSSQPIITEPTDPNPFTSSHFDHTSQSSTFLSSSSSTVSHHISTSAKVVTTSTTIISTDLYEPVAATTNGSTATVFDALIGAQENLVDDTVLDSPPLPSIPPPNAQVDTVADVIVNKSSSSAEPTAAPTSEMYTL